MLEQKKVAGLCTFSSSSLEQIENHKTVLVPLTSGKLWESILVSATGSYHKRWNSGTKTLHLHFRGKFCVEKGGICFMKQHRFCWLHTLQSLLLQITGQAVLRRAWTWALLSHPPNNTWDGGKGTIPAQLFQNVSTFKSLWHSQTGSFTNAWQLHSYLFLELSNTLQKAARNAKKPRTTMCHFLKKTNILVAMSYYFTACKMGGVILEIFPGTDSSDI